MNNEKELFSPDMLMRCQIFVKQELKALAGAPLLMFFCALQMLAFILLGIIEWEIIYKVFVYLSGDEGYWAPELMACTALIMIIGFHLLAKSNPGNLAVRIVHASVGLLIPIYLAGVGLLIATVMYGGGLGSMVSSSSSLSFGALPQIDNGNWLETLVSSFANPSAVLMFSIGIGGLAIVNIFVAHQLLVRIANNLEQLTTRISRAKTALKDHALVKRAHKEYAHLGIELDALNEDNNASLRLKIANETLSVIADGLRPHKAWLNEQALSAKPILGERENIDAKQITKEIAKIEAISLSDILSAINPKFLEEKS